MLLVEAGLENVQAYDGPFSAGELGPELGVDDVLSKSARRQDSEQ